MPKTKHDKHWYLKTTKPKGCTFVTCLYDLHTIDNTERKSIDEYLKNSDFLLKKTYNLVIYTTAEFADKIMDIRKSYNLGSKTCVITQPFEEIHTVSKYKKQLDHISKSDNKTWIFSNDKDTPNYYMLIWNKLLFVQETIYNNPFNTKYFAWHDFGLGHVINQTMKPCEINVKAIPKKIRFLVMEAHKIKPVEEMTYSEYPALIGGGLITGHEKFFRVFIQLFINKLESLLSSNIVVTEEYILANLYAENLDLCSAYFGTFYNTIYTNYHTMNHQKEAFKEKIYPKITNPEIQKAFVKYAS